MNEVKLPCIMVEDMSDELLQEIGAISVEEEKPKQSFKDAAAHKGVTVSPYINTSGYGGKYQH